MPDHSQILQSVYRAIDAVNEQFPADSSIAKSPTSAIYGGDGPLDSLGLITLMIAVEQQIESDFGQVVSLSAENASNGMDTAEDPFRRVDLLVKWLATVLAADKAAA